MTALEPIANTPETTGVSIHSGFPNPAAENHGRKSGLALDLNQLLVQHPSSTYMFRIRGHHWADQGIFDNDIAIIDRALSASPHDLVITWQEEAFEIHRRKDLVGQQSTWGVISAIIHPRTKSAS